MPRNWQASGHVPLALMATRRGKPVASCTRFPYLDAGSVPE